MALDVSVVVDDEKVAGLEVAVEDPLVVHPTEKPAERFGAAIGLSHADIVRPAGYSPQVEVEVLGSLDPLDRQVALAAIPGSAPVDGRHRLSGGDAAEPKRVAPLPTLHRFGGTERSRQCLPPLPRAGNACRPRGPIVPRAASRPRR